MIKYIKRFIDRYWTMEVKLDGLSFTIKSNIFQVHEEGLGRYVINRRASKVDKKFGVTGLFKKKGRILDD